jgi:hypothetical protein
MGSYIFLHHGTRRAGPQAVNLRRKVILGTSSKEVGTAIAAAQIGNTRGTNQDTVRFIPHVEGEPAHSADPHSWLARVMPIGAPVNARFEGRPDLPVLDVAGSTRVVEVGGIELLLGTADMIPLSAEGVEARVRPRIKAVRLAGKSWQLSFGVTTDAADAKAALHIRTYLCPSGFGSQLLRAAVWAEPDKGEYLVRPDLSLRRETDGTWTTWAPILLEEDADVLAPGTTLMNSGIAHGDHTFIQVGFSLGTD